MYPLLLEQRKLHSYVQPASHTCHSAEKAQAYYSANRAQPPFRRLYSAVYQPLDKRAKMIMPRLVGLWLGLVFGQANCIEGQAPGDGDPLCTQEIINGMPNPFVALHPVYSARERPLMDSRDYTRLLQESGNVYIPWQSVDRDNNNTGDVVTEVRSRWFHILAY